MTSLEAESRIASNSERYPIITIESSRQSFGIDTFVKIYDDGEEQTRELWHGFINESRTNALDKALDASAKARDRHRSLHYLQTKLPGIALD